MSDRLDLLKTSVAEFPTDCGVYLMRNDRDKILYVGKAKSLKSRVRSYFASELTVKTKYLMSHVVRIEYILTKTEVEAFLLEASLIKKHRPRYNIRLKDDKAYPYIRLSMEHEFPRLMLARRVSPDGAMYFGPYSSGASVRATMRFLNKTFKIRDCTDSFLKSRTRPCIAYQIGQCSAPCVGFIDKETYGEDIEAIILFLKGRSAKVLKSLKVQMESAANDERFEQAARMRDSIQAIERIWDRQTVVTMNQDLDQDVVAFVGDERGTLIETLHVRGGRVIGSRPHFINRLDASSIDEDVRDWLTSFLNQFYSDNVIPDEILLQVDLGHDLVRLLQEVFMERQKVRARISIATGSAGKKLMDLAVLNAKSHFEDAVTKADQQRSALEVIQEKLSLPRRPSRMECFDISNFQGDDNVASQVVFEDGLPRTSDYRRYKIKTVQGSNDFLAMKEVLNRRLQHTEYEDPDLIVVDGGKGQLKMAVEALKELGRSDIPLVAMAKARVQGSFQDKEVTGSQERFFLPGRQNPVTFSKNAEALNILVQLRDEAHRFAISFHRKLRSDRTLQSALDEIKGLGPRRKTELLKKFGSIEGIRDANIEDLLQIKGLSRLLAERILLTLR